LKSAELGNFIAEANVRGFLPAVRDEELNIVAATGKAAVARYLDAVSIPQNRNLAPVDVGDLSHAFARLTQEKEEAPLRDVLGKLNQNLTELRQAPVPGDALALHRQYLAATLALKASAEKLLAYQADYVGALVAASRIENLRGVFRAVEQGVRDLEQKYRIT
jgi:hypothetical protein